jgi:ABC-2 type transport system ATP-binding protein
MSDANVAIELTRVSKRYGEVEVVGDLDLAVRTGEVLGFLGPNGAGKTTTIRLLLGFLRPTKGTVHLLGRDMSKAQSAFEARRHLGYVPDLAGMDRSASGLWLLNELARLQRRPPVDQAALIDALALRPQDLRRPIGHLSRGTRQKINIVQGLQHRPDLLILDEPTEGLDPLVKQILFDLLTQTHRRGATILFSSHVLSEVEALSDRVALIRDGQLVAVDRIDELRAHLQRRVTVQVTEENDAEIETLREQLSKAPGISNLQRTDGRWQFLTNDVAGTLRLLAALPVIDVAIEPPSLADVFLQYYRSDNPHHG